MNPFYNRIRSYIKGYYRISASGQDMNRLWNMCAFHGVDIWNLTAKKEGYEFSVHKKDYALFCELIQKTEAKKTNAAEAGLPYFLKRVRNHLTFFLGIGAALALIMLLSQFIWSIRITGNSGYGTEELIRFLSGQNIEHGIPKYKIACSQLAASLREAFPNITWVTAKIQGTKLVIEMKENILPEEEKQIKETVPSNLVAEKDGVVVSIITRSGTPCVTVGSPCKKGDTLVAGMIPIYNDSQEIVRYEFVQSDADIKVETYYRYYDEFKRSYEKRSYRESKNSLFLQVGSWRLGDDYAETVPKEETKVRRPRQLHLTQTFGLPVYYGSVESRYYDLNKSTYTEFEAEELAKARFSRFLGNLKKKGVQIYGNNVKIEINDADCIIKGNVQVVESTGKSVEFAPQQIPIKETQEE